MEYEFCNCDALANLQTINPPSAIEAGRSANRHHIISLCVGCWKAGYDACICLATSGRRARVLAECCFVVVELHLRCAGGISAGGVVGPLLADIGIGAGTAAIWQSSARTRHELITFLVAINGARSR